MSIKDPRIAKITLNIGTGSDLNDLKKAEKLLKMLSDQKPVRTSAKATISELNVKQGDPIGVKVTLRGKKAEEVLKKSFEAVENTIKGSQISDNGNFSFGVSEYIEMPGMKYDPDIGMIGFDVCVDLERIGFRINRRRLKKKKLHEKVHIQPEEVEKFLNEKFGVKVE
ncbi:MAG: 50S ribosomal protein L5 [Candidatus Undinarchaeales archaeon]